MAENRAPDELAGEGNAPETPVEAERARRDRDSLQHTVLVALVLSLVCSLLVTAVAMQLAPLQARNEAENRQKNILAVAGLSLAPDETIAEAFEQIETRVVDLATGTYAPDIDPAEFDALAVKNDPALSKAIAPEQDIANIKRRANYAEVYLVRDGADVAQIILPVYGAGLWSTMYGFISLETDGNTISGLQFYEHAETPGLGDKVEDPDWLSLWEGKLVYGADGEPAVEVIRGKVSRDPARSNPPKTGDPVYYQVDGMAGATLTGRGVTNLLHYWLGEDGFGPYLARHWQRQGVPS